MLIHPAWLTQATHTCTHAHSHAQGGGDLPHCLTNASTARTAHATQLHSLGLHDLALQATFRSIECAHRAHASAPTFRAASLAVSIYEDKAVATTGNPASCAQLKVAMLQLGGLALDQCVRALPLGVSVGEVETLARKCEGLLTELPTLPEVSFISLLFSYECLV
mgnify:FL=1